MEREIGGRGCFPRSKSSFSGLMSYLWALVKIALSVCVSAPRIRSRTAECLITKYDLEEILELLSSILNFYPNQIAGRYISPTLTFVSELTPRIHSRDQTTLLCQKKRTQSEITRIIFSNLYVWSPFAQWVFGSLIYATD